MEYTERYSILKKWVIDIKKYNYCPSHQHNIKNEYDPYLVFYNKSWDKWQKLLKQYSHKQLSDYFIEIIRRDIPELKETRLYIVNWNITPAIFNYPKNKTDEFLYII